MIGYWEDLAYAHGLGHEEYDELKAWLRSQTQDLESTVTTTSHPLGMLRAALQAANLEIRDNLAARIAEAEREGWLGEVEGLQVSLAAAEDKLAQIDKRSRTAPVALGNPTLPANS